MERGIAAGLLAMEVGVDEILYGILDILGKLKNARQSSNR